MRRLGTTLKRHDQRLLQERHSRDETFWSLADDDWLDWQLRKRNSDSLRERWAQHRRALQDAQPVTGEAAQGVLFASGDFWAPGKEPWARWAVTDPAKLEDLYWYWAQFDRVALDFETDSLDAATAELVGVAIGAGTRHVYLPLRTLPCDAHLDWEAHVRPLLLQLYELEPTWCFWNALYDLTVWNAQGLPPIRRWEDGMIRQWTVHPHMPKGLKDQAEMRLGEQRASYSQVTGKERVLSGIALEKAAQYAAADSENTWDLEPILAVEVDGQGLQAHYDRAKALLPVAQWMEGQGMPIHRETLETRMQEALVYQRELVDRATAQARELSGDKKLVCILGEEDPYNRSKEFGQARRKQGVIYADRLNLRSTQQLQAFLFGRCGMQSDFGPGVKPGTNKSVLIRLRKAGHPIADTLLQLSKVGKILSGFYQPITERLVEAAGWHWIFARFSPWLPATGRWSCIAKGTLVEVLRDNAAHPDGIPIEDVRVGDLVYCYDDQLNLRIRPVLWAGKTGHKPVVRIHWRGTGNTRTGYVDTTVEHRIHLVDGTWKEAQHLVPGDRVLALTRGLDHEGYARLWPTGHPEIPREHRFIYEQLWGVLPEHVHHENENRLDNRPENLVGMTASEHTSYHGSRKSPELRQLLAEIMRQRWARGDYANRPRGAETYNWLGLTADWMTQVLWENAGQPTVFRDRYGIDYETAKKYLDYHQIEWQEIKRQFNSRGELLTEERIEAARRTHEAQGQAAAQKQIGLNYYRWREVQENRGYVPYNHEIVAVEVLNRSEDVYCLNVEDYHNFMAGGINVANSQSPNLQNICNPDPDYPWTMIRGAFCAPPGWKLIVGDLQQVELRLLAHYSSDPVFHRIFKEGGDIHAMTGAHLAGVTYEEFMTWEPPKGLKPEEFEWQHQKYVQFRKKAKPLNFGISYKMGPLKFSVYAADQFDVWLDQDEAATEVESWMRLYKGVPKYHDTVQRQILRQGYVETITGRRAYFDPHLQREVLKGNKASNDFWLGERQWRQAVNYRIQGSASDLINAALLDLYDRYYGGPAAVISQVHDEIIMMAPEGMAQAVADTMKSCMESNQTLSLPITASVRIADSWLDAH